MYNFDISTLLCEMEWTSKIVIIAAGAFIVYQIIGLLSSRAVELKMKGGNPNRQTTVYLFYTPLCHFCTTIRGNRLNGDPDPKSAWGKIYIKYNKSKDVKAVEINAHEDSSKVTLYNIEAYPTIVLVKRDGSHVEFTGDNNAEEIDKFIESNRA